MEQLNQGLFMAILKDDFQTAKKLLDAGANPNSIYEEEKGKFTSSFNLFIKKTSTLNYKKGSSNSQFRLCMELMKEIVPKSVLECKCLKEHKCPLFIALETFKIKDENEILEGKCDIIRYLIINGATLKFEEKQNKKNDKISNVWKLPWIDVEGLRAYLITKKFDFKGTHVEKPETPGIIV